MDSYYEQEREGEWINTFRDLVQPATPLGNFVLSHLSVDA